MITRAVLLGAVLAVVAAGLVVNLAILDVVPASVVTQTLGKTLSLILVTTLAIVLILVILRSARKT